MSSQNPKRPRLASNLDPQVINDWYWLLVELREFCREHGLSRAGGKQDIATRIAHFLRTGQRAAPVKIAMPELDSARSFNQAPFRSFSMQTRVPAGFRCTQAMRRFFEQQLGPTFRFTVPLQRFMRTNPGVTFAEIAEEWHRQSALRKQGWKPEISAQFEFNQFTRDFHADPANRGKSRQDCLQAWKAARSQRGESRRRTPWST